MPRPKKNGNGVDAKSVASAVVQEVFQVFHARGNPLDMEEMAAVLTAVDKRVSAMKPQEKEEVTT